MAYGFIRNRGDALGANGGTSGAFDSTGADFLVVAVSSDQAVAAPVITDSQSLTWTQVGGTSYTTNTHRITLYFALATSTSATHTVTATRTSGFVGIEILAFSGAQQSPTPEDQHNGATNNATTSQQPGSITPTANNCLVITGLTDNAGGTIGVPAGYTGFSVAQIGGTNYGISIAYKIQTTASAENPTWTSTNSVQLGAEIVSFFAAAGGGASPFLGSTFENPIRQRRSVDALSWTSNDLTIRLPVAPVASPFFVTDWPNPRGRTPLNTSFASNYAIDDSAPFAQTDWPNPVRAKRNTDGLSWEDELNTLLFTAPGVPFSQHEWPNPVRAKRNTDGLSWQDELNTLLFAPPVTMPFRQLVWPNPSGKPFGVSLRGFTQASAFWMLKDTFYGAPGQPPSFTPPINPRGPVFPMELRGSTHNALTILPTPPVSTFNPAWAQGSNRTVGFGIEPE